MTVLSLITSYLTFINLPINLLCLPWILASLVAKGNRATTNDGGQLFVLPWPYKSLTIIAAFPMLPLGHLSLALATIPILQGRGPGSAFSKWKLKIKVTFWQKKNVDQ
jgi:hypothetical protein